MLIKNKYYLCLIFLCTFLSIPACGKADTSENAEIVESTSGQNNTQTPMQESVEKKFTVCTEPRPQICTREYNPVCANLQDGKMKTYATGCTACADHEVTGYRHGACE